MFDSRNSHMFEGVPGWLARTINLSQSRAPF